MREVVDALRQFLREQPATVGAPVGETRRVRRAAIWGLAGVVVLTVVGIAWQLHEAGGLLE